MGIGHLITLIVVAALVISAILYYAVVARSRPRAAPRNYQTDPSGAPSALPVQEGLKVAEATLRLQRIWSGIAIGGQSEEWNITIDGTVVDAIANQETVEVAVEPGHHTVRLGQGRHLSPRRSFDVGEGETFALDCHGPRFWPMLLAALVKSDLWITLRPV